MSDGLIVGICLFLRGPQPVTCATRVPVFEHFFAPFFQTSFFTTTGAKRCQTGSLKRAQNRTNLEKRPPEQGFKKKDGKSRGKVYFPESWICNPYTPVQSKHTFSFSRFDRKSDAKSLPKWSLGALQITQNQEKRALKKTMKNNTAKSGFVVAF